jgi:TPR repeat protein
MRIAITKGRASKFNVLMFFVGISLMLGGNFSYAENFESGFEAYKRGDFSNAMRIFRLTAEQGDSTAQYNLGVMYRDGQGVPQDNVYAYMWWSIAASNGSDMGVGNRDKVFKEMTKDQVASPIETNK